MGGGTLTLWGEGGDGGENIFKLRGRETETKEKNQGEEIGGEYTYMRLSHQVKKKPSPPHQIFPSHKGVKPSPRKKI